MGELIGRGGAAVALVSGAAAAAAGAAVCGSWGAGAADGGVEAAVCAGGETAAALGAVGGEGAAAGAGAVVVGATGAGAAAAAIVGLGGLGGFAANRLIASISLQALTFAALAAFISCNFAVSSITCCFSIASPNASHCSAKYGRFAALNALAS